MADILQSSPRHPQTGVNLTYIGTPLPTPDHEWNFDEGSGSTAHDSAGSDDGTLHSSPGWNAGVEGDSLTFNGANQYMDVSSVASNTFTISAWIDVSTSGSNIQTIMASKGGGWSDGFAFYVNTYNTTDHRLLVETSDGVSLDVTTSIDSSVPAGEWCNVAVTIDRTNGVAHLYVNGQDVTAPGGSVVTDFNTGLTDIVGAMQGGILWFTGEMDDIRTYSSILTGDQIARLAAKEGLEDASGDVGGIVPAGDKYTGLDSFGRIVDQQWVNGSGNVMDQYLYNYDKAGNVTAMLNTLDSALSETYTYDLLNRLTDTERNDANYQDFGLDALGNIDSLTNGTNSAVTSTFNSQNELTSDGGNSLTFDSNGNTTTDENGNKLVYDAWNRLVQVNNSSNTNIVTYAYDGENRRITETNNGGDPVELYYNGQQVVQEDVNHSGTLTLHAQYFWGAAYENDLILRDRDTDGNGTLDERLYVTHDANYNVTSILNSSGTTQERFAYDAYGKMSVYSSSWAGTSDSFAWNYTFQGGRTNVALGQVWFQARIMDVNSGKWLTADPILVGDGVNYYQLEHDGPVDRLDPTGLDTMTDAQAFIDAHGRTWGFYRYEFLLDYLRRTGVTMGSKHVPSPGFTADARSIYINDTCGVGDSPVSLLEQGMREWAFKNESAFVDATRQYALTFKGAGYDVTGVLGQTLDFVHLFSKYAAAVPTDNMMTSDRVGDVYIKVFAGLSVSAALKAHGGGYGLPITLLGGTGFTSQGQLSKYYYDMTNRQFDPNADQSHHFAAYFAFGVETPGASTLGGIGLMGTNDTPTENPGDFLLGELGTVLGRSYASRPRFMGSEITSDLRSDPTKGGAGNVGHNEAINAAQIYMQGY